MGSILSNDKIVTDVSNALASRNREEILALLNSSRFSRHLDFGWVTKRLLVSCLFSRCVCDETAEFALNHINGILARKGYPPFGVYDLDPKPFIHSYMRRMGHRPVDVFTGNYPERWVKFYVENLKGDINAVIPAFGKTLLQHFWKVRGRDGSVPSKTWGYYPFT